MRALTSSTLLMMLALFGCATDDARSDDAGTAPGNGATDPDDEDTDAGEPDDGLEPIDEEEAVAEARELVGTSEDEVEEDANTRISRRGDEHLPGTMDLRPGRRNLELDDDGTGTYIVTRVVIEQDGEDLVVE